MPTIAETAKEKRLFSELFNDGDTKSKKQRVRFDDNVEVLTEEDSELDEEEDEEDVEFVLSIGEDGDFDYTIITTTAATASSESYKTSEEDIKEPSSSPNHHPNDKITTRPASPFAGSDRRLCEELYMSPSSSSVDGVCACCEGIPTTMMLSSFSFNYSRSSSMNWPSIGLGNNLKILIPSSTSSDEDEATFAKGPPQQNDDDDAASLTPLITPPSSPGKLTNGTMTDDSVVICEWPCNLTVDNAITSALELPL